AAARDIGLDMHTGGVVVAGEAGEAEVFGEQMIDGAEGVAADREAVPVAKPVVADCVVVCAGYFVAADGDLVIAHADVRLRDGDVGGVVRVNAVGVARVVRRDDFYAPGSEIR